MIKRGTTPEHSFTLPFTLPEGTEYRIVYAQGEKYKEKILFEKTTEDITVDGDTLVVELKAEETLLIDCTPKWVGGKFEPPPVKVQVGYRTPGSKIMWSEILEKAPGRLLKEDGEV